MSKEKEQEIIYQKIEVDKKSAEPILIDVNVKNIKDNSEEKPKKQKLPVRPEIGSDKQLIMNKVLGVDHSQSTTKKQALFKKLGSLFFISFVIIVLGVTAYNDFFSGKKELLSWPEVFAVLGKNWHFIAFAFISLFLCYFLKAFKLSFLCRYKTGKWHFKTCMSTAVLGHYYNYITPLAVGGQPFEIYHLAHHGVHGGVAASLPIATFFLLQFGFVILSVASLILYSTNLQFLPKALQFFPVGLPLLAIIGIICCFFVPLMVVIFSIFPRLGGKIVYFAIWLGSKFGLVKDVKTLNYKMNKNILQNSKCLKSFASNPFVFGLSLLLSIGENLALCSIAYFTLKFFGYDIVEVGGFNEWVQVCLVCMLLYAAISFIPTPGNSGAADLSFYLLFESGLAAIGNVAFPATLTWRLISFYSFIIIGFIYTKISRAREKRKEKQ